MLNPFDMGDESVGAVGAQMQCLGPCLGRKPFSGIMGGWSPDAWSAGVVPFFCSWEVFFSCLPSLLALLLVLWVRHVWRETRALVIAYAISVPVKWGQATMLTVMWEQVVLEPELEAEELLLLPAPEERYDACR